MPNVKVVDMAGKEVGSMQLSEKVFGAEVKKAVLHAAVRAYLLNQRQGTQSALTRAEVSGGGIKPYRQKEPVEPDRVPPAHRSGRMAAWYLRRSPVLIARI